MFSDEQKEIALSFAKRLAERKYGEAYDFLSSDLQKEKSQNELMDDFVLFCSEDCGSIEDIVVVDEDYNWPFVYVSLSLADAGYTEAVMVASFICENGEEKVSSYEIGRP